MKMLREKYKTYDGAMKRCRFENSLAPGEYRRGDKARLYHYTVVQDAAGMWRVARDAGAK